MSPTHPPFDANAGPNADEEWVEVLEDTGRAPAMNQGAKAAASDPAAARLSPAAGKAEPWRVLVVDDEADIIRSTQFSLRDVQVDGRGLLLLQAASAAEALALLRQDGEIAVLLLDVVMETPDAGLRLVEQVRALPERQWLRIILRTGQPGYAPELEVIRRYDINDYKTKAELTQTRLITSLTVAIRGYHQLCRIEAHQRGLEKVVAASGSLLTERGSLQSFAEGVLTQILSITTGLAAGVVLIRGALVKQEPAQAGLRQGPAQVVAAAGCFSGLVGAPVSSLPEDLQKALSRCDLSAGAVLDLGTQGAVLVHGHAGDELLLVLSTQQALDPETRRLLALFAINLSLAMDGIQSFRELEHFAHHDRETGLVNRAGLNRSIGAAAGRSFAQVAIGELHELRGVLGETVARQALFDLGQRLVGLIGDDGVVARLQGDRFALALASPVAPSLMGGLLDALAQPLRVGQMALQLPMALGWSESAATVDQGIDEAGLMATQPAVGRQVRGASFAVAVREQVRARIALLSDLPLALLEDRIELHLQAQVRLSDAQVVGHEALVRWRRSDGRLSLPGQFISVLEHTGAVVSLGQRVIEKAVQQLRASSQQGLRISVNLSVRQLEEPAFPAWLIAHCQQHEVAQRRLRLEITESAFAQDAQQVGDALAQLTAAGFELSIDDFGTGQSSLGRLAEIQVHELKLDRSLVRGIEHDPRARRVARLIVELGRDLGVEVLAEGIETEGQLAVLRELGCALGQGWLFGRPVAAQLLQV